jgi:hypothetical protein
VQKHVEVQDALGIRRPEAAHKGRIRHSRDRYSAGSAHAQQQFELPLRVEARDNEKDILDIRPRTGIETFLDAPPNLGEVGVNQIGVPQLSGKGPAQRLGVETVPESSLDPSRLQPRSAERIPSDQDPMAVN